MGIKNFEDEKEDPWNDECNSSTIGEDRTRVTEIKIIRAGLDCDGEVKAKAKIFITYAMIVAFLSGDLEAGGKALILQEFFDVMEVSCTAGTKMCIGLETKTCMMTLSFWKWLFGYRNPFVYSWEEGEETYWEECEGGAYWLDEYDCYTDPGGAREDLKDCLRDLGVGRGDK